jgi:hypothetical protein
MIERIAEGRTDLVFDSVGAGNSATTKDSQGTSLIQWCAYYGDVSAIKFLVSKGEVLQSLGDNLGLDGALFTVIGGSANFFSRTARMRTRHCRKPGKRRCTQRCLRPGAHSGSL